MAFGMLGLRLTGLVRARSSRTGDPRVDADMDGDRKLRERAASPGVILERNSFRIGSVASLDLSIAKEWEFGEGRRVAVALDMFNLTKRLNPKQYQQSYGARAAPPVPAFRPPHVLATIPAPSLDQPRRGNKCLPKKALSCDRTS